MKRSLTIIILFVLVLNLMGQPEKKNRFSFSISWTPVLYGGSNDEGFRFDAVIPISFESIIHFNISNSISVSSGIGYLRNVSNWGSWLYLSSVDLTKSTRVADNTLRLPIQLSYKVLNSLQNIDPYIKAEFANEWSFNNITYYQSDIIEHTSEYTIYFQEISVGIGSYFRQNKPVGLLFEGSLGSYLDNDFLKMYLLRLKIGIILNSSKAQ